jgi:hypothetical protein
MLMATWLASFVGIFLMGCSSLGQGYICDGSVGFGLGIVFFVLNPVTLVAAFALLFISGVTVAIHVAATTWRKENNSIAS